MGLPADVIFGADNVTVSALPAGFKVYGGYWNGPYANMSALARRFPSATLISIAVRLAGSTGARSADAEPGTLSSSQAGNFEAVAQFLRVYKGTVKPIVYTMASWARALELFLDSRGIPRSSYYLWTAHYNGLHLCGPHSCGFGASDADMTQYATGANDYNVIRGYVPTGTAGPVPSPYITVPGVSAQQVQAALNKWARYCGFGPLVVDGGFGAKTVHAVREFQSHRGQGLKVDGIVGGATWKFLRNPPGIVKRVVHVPVPAPRPVVPSGNPVLAAGTVGQQVAAMQYYLSHSGLAGVRGINADGSFGPATETALRNFQKLRGLTVDGLYGPATAKALARVAIS